MKKNNLAYVNVFILGLLIGSLAFYFVSQYNTHNIYFSKIETIKNYTNEKLINYIEGKWASALNEIIIVIHPLQQSGTIKVYDKIKETTKEYKITKLEYIDGFFGYTKLLIHNGEKSNMVIQINKIFGIDNVIVITYPDTFSGCADKTHSCVRAFKRLE